MHTYQGRSKLNLERTDRRNGLNLPANVLVKNQFNNTIGKYAMAMSDGLSLSPRNIETKILAPR